MTEAQQNPIRLTHVAELLESELRECHDAVMSAFHFAAQSHPAEMQLVAMKAASRMMQSTAQAALALQRLHNPGTHHTVTVEGGRVPTPEKSKTNGAA